MENKSSGTASVSEAAVTPETSGNGLGTTDEETRDTQTNGGAGQEPGAGQGGEETMPADSVAEIARLRAELQRAIAKNDQLATENNAQRKRIRSYQTAEEISKEEAEERTTQLQKQYDEVLKKLEISEIKEKLKSVITDENAVATAADALHGATDADAVIAVMKKALAAQEKQLKIQFGRIPAPGAGGGEGPALTRKELDAMSLSDRIKYKQEHAEDYRRLMGRA